MSPQVSGKARVSRPIQPSLPTSTLQFLDVTSDTVQYLQQQTQPFTAVNKIPLRDLSYRSSGHHHILLSPTLESAGRCYQLVQKALRVYPQISVVIVSPKSQNLTSFFPQWKEFPTIPGTSKVFTNYVSPKEEVIPFSTSSTSTVITVEVHKSPYQVLLDTGATGSGFVTQKFCEVNKVQQRTTKHTTVHLGDNSVVTSHKKAVIPIVTNSFSVSDPNWTACIHRIGRA